MARGPLVPGKYSIRLAQVRARAYFGRPAVYAFELQHESD